MLYLLPLFFIIALIYSSVGLAGGSAYITVMVLADVPKEVFPLIALGCNAIVSAIGSYRFWKGGFFRSGLFWPLALTSIPCSYLGGMIHISTKAFTLILAIALTIAALRLIFTSQIRPIDDKQRGFKIIYGLIVGAILGLLAGITGIGGGIYLIPVLIFLNWAKPHEASALASLFIFVNSVSGIAGQLTRGHFDVNFFLPLAGVVLAGGFIGSRIGTTRLKGETIQKIVAFIMIVAVIKLIGKLI